MLSAGKPEKILIISQFYYPDVTACAFRIKETAEWLSNQGLEVHVIAGEPHKGQIDNKEIDDGNIKVTRVPLFKYEGGGKWNYIRHYLSFMLGAIKASFKHKGTFDIVWASSPPLFTGIAGYLIAKIKRAAFCLDIRDIWPESAVVAGQISDKGLLFKGAKIVEKALYRLADKTSCVANPMADYIKSISKRKRPVVIYNAIPEKLLGKEPDKTRQPGDTIEILYIGNMGYCQNLGLVVKAAEALAQRQEKRIRFKLTGNGVEKEFLENEIKKLNLNNIEISGVVAKEKAIELIKNADALMLHLKDDGTMNKTIPSKVFDYMAAGKPVLYGLKGEAADILEVSGGNLYYNPTSHEQLVSQAIKLAENYEHLTAKARHNRVMVKQKFLREKMAARLLTHFSS
ncbi:MAG: glycosyltransferase family 4 protein [Candidatus Rifleibacteriota bacterium]